jgi:hypothetical protein
MNVGVYCCLTKEGVDRLMEVDVRYVRVFLLMASEMMYGVNDVTLDDRRMERWCVTLGIDVKTLKRYLRQMSLLGVVKMKSKRWAVVHPLIAFKCPVGDVGKIMRMHGMFTEGIGEKEKKNTLKNVVGNME